MTLIQTHLYAKIGVLAVVLVGMAVRQPFTLVYAREQVDPAYWNSPRLLRTSQIITAAWAGAFAVMAAGDLALILRPDLPHYLTFVVSTCCFLAAGAFTLWFAARAKSA